MHIGNQHTWKNTYSQYKRLCFDVGVHHAKMSVTSMSWFLADVYFTGGGGGLNGGGISSLKKRKNKRLVDGKVTNRTRGPSDVSLTFSEWGIAGKETQPEPTWEEKEWETHHVTYWCLHLQQRDDEINQEEFWSLSLYPVIMHLPVLVESSYCM